MKKNTGLILALDVSNKNKAIAILQEVYDLIDAVKVGYPLLLANGLDIIKEIKKFNSVIVDLKVADIPNTNKLICESLFNSGADAIIVHGFTGKDSMEAGIKVAKQYGKEIYVVTEMSHSGAIQFLQPVALQIAKLAKEVGANGVIAPATRPERIKEISSIVGDLTIISPGVGAQGGSFKEAISAGADYIIVGRSIYLSENPRECTKEILESLNQWFKSISLHEKR
ncbi:MAG: orotidine-5'-phosphate decarboxylase [Methanosarcinales archaeon]